MKLFLLFTLLLSLPHSSAQAYSFSNKPETWTDAEVESFLFLSQVQKKSGLNKSSNLCLDVSGPVQGGKQRMRIISKVGDNKNGGLFETAKAEVKAGTPAQNDLNTIKSIVGMSTGYQQAIMDYDENTAPIAKDAATAKQYMSAEVIGYTDGQGISGTLNAAIDGNPVKSFSSNKQLGKLRADYLANELGLSDSFADVKKSSKESERALKEPKYDEIRNCDTWRTAEVRMYFQTGSKVTDEKSWSMTTMMMPKEDRALLQYEASRQVMEAQREFSDSVLYSMKPKLLTSSSPGIKSISKTPEIKPTMIRAMTTEMKGYCSNVFEALKAEYLDAGTKTFRNPYANEINKCKQKNEDICFFECTGSIKSFYVSLSSGGGPYSSISNSISFRFNIDQADQSENSPKENLLAEKTLKEYLKKVPSVVAAREVIIAKRQKEFEKNLKQKFPNCANDAKSFDDLKALFERVTPQLNSNVYSFSRNIDKFGNKYLGYEQNGVFEMKEDIKAFVGAAVTTAKDGTGIVIKGLKCLDMKRVMGAFYAKGECRRGDEFNKVMFPHKNVQLGCIYCGSGWNVKNGSASYQEREDKKISPIIPHEHGKTYDVASVDALRSPGVHEIADCADCNCTDKGSKLAKIYTVEKASDENLVPVINKNSCYCTPPVAPSCGVGPSGAANEAKLTSLGQKHFYDACSGKFVKTTGDTKTAQITNLLNTFNKGCVSEPGKCPNLDIRTAINAVNNMLCEKQNFRIPSDDPVKDCSREDGKVESVAEPEV